MLAKIDQAVEKSGTFSLDKFKVDRVSVSYIPHNLLGEESSDGGINLLEVHCKWKFPLQFMFDTSHWR